MAAAATAPSPAQHGSLLSPRPAKAQRLSELHGWPAMQGARLTPSSRGQNRPRPARVAGLTDLPVDLLLRIFSHLEFQDRKLLATVCTTFRDACEAPELWERVSLDLSKMPPFEKLEDGLVAAWFSKRAPGIRRFHFAYSVNAWLGISPQQWMMATLPQLLGSVEDLDLSCPLKRPAFRLVAGCSRLHRLKLRLEGRMDYSQWLGSDLVLLKGLKALRHLSVLVTNEEVFDADCLAGATQLHSLALGSASELSDDFAALTQLTALTLTEYTGDVFPKFVTALTSLERLSCGWWSEEAAPAVHLPQGLERLQALRALSLRHVTSHENAHMLPQLPRLTSLEFHECRWRALPAPLTACTGLRTLRASGHRLAALPPSVSALQRLELLDLRVQSQPIGLPESLTRLTQLRRMLLVPPMPSRQANNTQWPWLMLRCVRDPTVELPICAVYSGRAFWGWDLGAVRAACVAELLPALLRHFAPLLEWLRERLSTEP